MLDTDLRRVASYSESAADGQLQAGQDQRDYPGRQVWGHTDILV